MDGHSAGRSHVAAVFVLALTSQLYQSKAIFMNRLFSLLPLVAMLSAPSVRAKGVTPIPIALFGQGYVLVNKHLHISPWDFDTHWGVAASYPTHHTQIADTWHYVSGWEETVTDGKDPTLASSFDYTIVVSRLWAGVPLEQFSRGMVRDAKSVFLTWPTDKTIAVLRGPIIDTSPHSGQVLVTGTVLGGASTLYAAAIYHRKFEIEALAFGPTRKAAQVLKTEVSALQAALSYEVTGKPGLPSTAVPTGTSTQVPTATGTP